MRKILFLSTFVTLLYCSSSSLQAQCDTVATICNTHISDGFISDGQQYRALLFNVDETAEFHTTFYGGTTYRLAACSGLDDGNLIFSVFDKDRNLLFESSEFRNAPYWDFSIKNTLDCIIEAKLDPSNQGSGCAVILIGFKR